MTKKISKTIKRSKKRSIVHLQAAIGLMNSITSWLIDIETDQSLSREEIDIRLNLALRQAINAIDCYRVHNPADDYERVCYLLDDEEED